MTSPSRPRRRAPQGSYNARPDVWDPAWHCDKRGPQTSSALDVWPRMRVWRHEREATRSEDR